MTTMQSPAPLDRLSANTGQEPVGQVVLAPELVLDPPYQRGSVWGLRRRRNLIRSLMLGIPVGDVFLNLRSPRSTSVYVVDGKQRIETLRMFLAGELSVPASWFEASMIEDPIETEDGPYVTYLGLSKRGRLKFDRCAFTTQRTFLPTVEAEAELFDLINYGGVPQGERDEDV